METSFVQVSFQNSDIQKAKKCISNVFFVLLMASPTASHLPPVTCVRSNSANNKLVKEGDYFTSCSSAVNSPAKWPGLVAAFKADLLVPPFVTLSASHCYISSEWSNVLFSSLRFEMYCSHNIKCVMGVKRGL
jgi:hypothetical protein